MPDRADAAGDIARRLLRRRERRHLGALASGGGRQGFQIELAIDRNERDEQAAIHLRDECLEDERRGEAKCGGCLQPVRFSAGLMLVLEQIELNASRGCRLDLGSHGCLR